MSLVYLLFFGNLISHGDDHCEAIALANKIHEAPDWWGLDLDDKIAKAKLEKVINELLLLDVDCFRAILVEYFEHYMGSDEEERLGSKATFQLIFYGYCNVGSKDWRWYTGPISDTQLTDKSWNPGGP